MRRDPYVIDLRLGPAEGKVQERLEELYRAAGSAPGPASPPSISLSAPFLLKNGVDEEGLYATIEAVFAGTGHLSLVIDGWSRSRKGGGWNIGCAVRPKEGSGEWHGHFVAALGECAEPANGSGLCQPAGNLSIRGVRVEGLGPMLTLWEALGGRAWWGERLLIRLFSQIHGQNRKLRPFCLPFDVLRIAVRRGGEVMAEFDLTSSGWLRGPVARDASEWQRSLRRYRISAGKELPSPLTARTRSTYVISDLHLGHAAIIRSCARPFPSWDGTEMDAVLVANWNNTVFPGDHVFFLGDMTYHARRSSSRAYCHELAGKITFIRGNHDTGVKDATDRVLLTTGGRTLLFLHNPADAPEAFKGWIVHGHLHNSDLGRYPFLNAGDRRVNVSAEVINYSPLSLSLLSAIINEVEARDDRTARYLTLDDALHDLGDEISPLVR